MEMEMPTATANPLSPSKQRQVQRHRHCDLCFPGVPIFWFDGRSPGARRASFQGGYRRVHREGDHLLPQGVPPVLLLGGHQGNGKSMSPKASGLRPDCPGVA